MENVTVFTGALEARDARFAIVAGRFNEFIVDQLLKGAIDALVRQGAATSAIDVYRVPGAFEIPLLARRVAARGDYDAVIALGAVIRGSTPHFDYVAGECARGIARVALESDIPVIFGVLTVNTLEQAIERAGTKSGNKGADAAASAVEMVNLLRQIRRDA